MRDAHAGALLLQAAAELGLLAVRDLFVEIALLAADATFTTAEVCAHAALPENHRLRAAIEAACGEVSPRKLGKILAKWEGFNVASLRIDCTGTDALGILWRVSQSKHIPDRTALAENATIIALPREDCPV